MAEVSMPRSAALSKECFVSFLTVKPFCVSTFIISLFPELSTLSAAFRYFFLKSEKPLPLPVHRLLNPSHSGRRSLRVPACFFSSSASNAALALINNVQRRLQSSSGVPKPCGYLACAPAASKYSSISLIWPQTITSCRGFKPQQEVLLFCFLLPVE